MFVIISTFLSSVTCLWSNDGGIFKTCNNIHCTVNYAPFVFICFIFIFYRITKPLTFADCVGDELPLGWETVYDQQIGVYYMDHINRE